MSDGTTPNLINPDYISTSNDTYQRITIGDNTVENVGGPGPLPADLVGLQNVSLYDICKAIDPCPEQYRNTGFYQVS